MSHVLPPRGIALHRRKNVAKGNSCHDDMCLRDSKSSILNIALSIRAPRDCCLSKSIAMYNEFLLLKYCHLTLPDEAHVRHSQLLPGILQDLGLYWNDPFLRHCVDQKAPMILTTSHSSKTAVRHGPRSS